MCQRRRSRSGAVTSSAGRHLLGSGAGSVLTLASRARPRSASLRDQLDRAASSTVLNLAEGVGRSTAADQARCFAIARGSALECVAIWDILRAQGVLSGDDHSEGRRLLARVVAMLTRLMRAGHRAP